MSRFLLLFAAAATLFAAADVARAQNHKIKRSVTFAKSWEAAVDEAKMLNVPIVVHSHGFYCGPCWGMHGSVLQNKKYIQFANANTVEVISLSRLDEGRKAGDRKAATYEAKDGNEYMVEFPNLTYEEMIALNRSKAASYNDTGRIPFTAIVDPHSLAEVQRWSGGTSSKTIMKAVTEATKKLVAEHGRGISRRTIRNLDEAREKATELCAKDDFSAAMKALAKASSKEQGWPEPLRERLASARRDVIAKARARLEEVSKSEGAAAKRELARLVRKLDGTGLESEAKELLAAM